LPFNIDFQDGISGLAEYKLLESMPSEMQTSLPSIEQIERELSGTGNP
jgi:hypothetical protein